MAEANGLFAGADQALEEIIDGEVAGGAGEDLFATAGGLADELDDGGGFASAGRAVNDGHVASGEGELDGRNLRGIEGRVEGRDGLRLIEAERPQIEEAIAELGEAAAICCGGAAEGGLLALANNFVTGKGEAVGGAGLFGGGRIGEDDIERTGIPAADDAAPARLVGEVFFGEEDGRADAEAVPGKELVLITLGERDDDAAAKGGLLITNDQLEEAGAGALGSAGGLALGLIGELAGLGGSLEVEEAGEAVEVSVAGHIKGGLVAASRIARWLTGLKIFWGQA